MPLDNINAPRLAVQRHCWACRAVIDEAGVHVDSGELTCAWMEEG